MEAETSPDSMLRSFLAENDAPCPACGYNLRGLDSIACPECGMRVTLGIVEPQRWSGGIVACAACLSLFIGYHLFSLVHFAFAYVYIVRQGVPFPLMRYIATHALLTLVFAGVLLGLLFFRQRLAAMPQRQRRGITIGICTAAALLFGVVFTLEKMGLFLT